MPRLFSWKVVSWKPFSKLFYICLSLKKLVNRKHFSVKGKFDLVFEKIFSFYFGRKTLFRSCDKIKNIMLYADYIKFDIQTFDCYIFILFEIIYEIVIFFFNFIIFQLFYLLDLISIILIVIYFIWDNLWN